MPTPLLVCLALALVPAATGLWQRPPSVDEFDFAPSSAPILQPIVQTLKVDGVNGFTTYRLIIKVAGSVQNIYTIYGDKDAPMEMPAAYQVRGTSLATSFPSHLTQCAGTHALSRQG
jgi:hypothetical protein